MVPSQTKAFIFSLSPSCFLWWLENAMREKFLRHMIGYSPPIISAWLSHAFPSSNWRRWPRSAGKHNYYSFTSSASWSSVSLAKKSVFCFQCCVARARWNGCCDLLLCQNTNCPQKTFRVYRCISGITQSNLNMTIGGNKCNFIEKKLSSN